jgi:ribonuclease VapC
VNGARKPTVSKTVIDASALLALLNAEPGADIVADALPDRAISAVNLSEVIAGLSAAGMPENAIRQALRSLGLEIIPFDEEQAYQAGLLYTSTREAGLSLGDRACLGLSVTLGISALTADRVWAGLPVGITIQVIR